VTDVAHLLEEAEAHALEGWDFSWLGGRMRTAPLPWNFDETVATHAQGSPDLLDMETGGGEWLARLIFRPRRTVATESWPPNVDVAGSRLRPLGITVVQDEGAPENVEQSENETRGRLPFPSESFALISNRHGTFVAAEVARVLAPRGVFLTEQVGGDYDEFYDALDLPHPTDRRREWNVQLATEQLERAGLRVTESADALEETTFADVGAFAWYLKAIPWVVAGFSVATHRAPLERLQARIDDRGPITVRQPAFWARAVKPG
jgi:SAM-dependent methyltransferase